MEDSLKAMTKEVQDFCEARDWDQFHGPKELAIGISTEANELLAIFRFKSDEQIKEAFEDEKKLAHIKEELADTFFFVLRFAQMNNLDLGECLEEKIKRNNEKYPVDKIKGKNLKYNEIN